MDDREWFEKHPVSIANSFPDLAEDYESPITRIVADLQEQREEQEWNYLRCRITEKIGYGIDKDELIKALNYDRGQYEKGYRDAIRRIIGIVENVSLCPNGKDGALRPIKNTRREDVYEAVQEVKRACGLCEPRTWAEWKEWKEWMTP